MIEKLALLFDGLVPPEVIQAFWNANANITNEELRFAKTGYDIANWALLRLEEVKVGDFEIDYKAKQTALENLREEFKEKYEKLSQRYKGSYVFYVDQQL